MEKDDSEEEIINSGSSGSPENSTAVSSPLDDSPLDDHPHLRANTSSSPSRTPSTPSQTARSPEAMVRVSPVGAPVGAHIQTTPPRPTLAAPSAPLMPPTSLAGVPNNLASNIGLAAMSSLFGMGTPNLADMANKTPEEQQQISHELQSNILQLLQAVQANANLAKAQQEEKARQEEAERAAREAAQIAEFIQHELSHEQRSEMNEFLVKNPRVSIEDSSILFTAKFGKWVSSQTILECEEENCYADYGQMRGS